MGKIEKKKAKLKIRINELQSEMNEAITKKTSKKKEINLGEYMTKITQLQKEYDQLK